MTRTSKRLCTTLLTGVLAPGWLLAQAQTSGKINGRVVDADGGPLAGAVVSANAPALNLERETVTGASGEFLFALLPIGAYTISVTHEGFQPEVITLQLGLGQIVPLDVTLRPGDTLGETIEVSSTASALETTVGGASFNYERQVEELPLAARDPESVIAALAPVVSSGASSTQTPGTFNIAGAPSFDTTVLLDGAEISDPYFGSAPDLFLEDAIEEVQVLATGVSARYGRFQGGVINAVTKSGSNEFEGVLRAELDKESWNSKTPHGEGQSDNLNKTYQGTLGGYILRDRLWFFGGLRKLPETVDTTNTVATDEAIATPYNEERWQLKLRGALTPSHLVELSTTEFDGSSENRPGLTPGDGLAVGSRSDPRTTYVASYQGVFGANTYAELQWTRKEVAIQEGGNDTVRDPFLDYNSIIVYNNGWWDYNDGSQRDNETWGATLTHVLSTQRAGHHTLEGGFQYVESTTGGENKQSPTGFNLLAANSEDDFYAGQVSGEPRYNLYNFEAYRWEAIALGGGQVVENPAVYLQDTIALDRFRIDLGVRYEKYDGSGPLPQFQMDFDGFAPRLGLTYSVLPQLQLQATWGRYIARFNDNVANDATGVSSAPRIERLYTGPSQFDLTADELQAILRNDAYWQIVTDYVDPRFATTVLATDIEAPYADELTLGLRGELPQGRGTYVLTYVDRSFENLLDSYVGGICDYGFDFGRSCPQGNTTDIVFNGELISSVDTTVWANNPDARRDYRAFTGVVDWRPLDRLGVGANYTYAKTRTNYEGEGRNTPASGTAIGDYERAVETSLIAPYGYSDDDIRHRLNVYATYQLDFARFGSLAVGSMFRYRSGIPWSKTATLRRAEVADYLTEAGTYTAFFGRGTERFEDWWSLDLSLRYEVPVWRDVRPFVKLGISNLLNNDAVVQHQVSGRAVRDTAGNLAWEPIGTCGLDDSPARTCSAFGRIRNEFDYQAPRSYLLTLALAF